jgi:hypothetical protein
MRRAIAGQRGSVRGAPPEVYAGFMQIPGDAEEQREQLIPAITFFKTWLVIVPCTIIAIWIIYAMVMALCGKNPLVD